MESIGTHGIWKVSLPPHTPPPPKADSLTLLSVKVVPSLSKVGPAEKHGDEMLSLSCSSVKSKLKSRSNSSVTKPLQTAWTKRHIFNSDLVFSLVSAIFNYVTLQISMRLQWFLNCNAHLMLKMFTEAIVLLNQCASIWIFMVYFEGSFSPRFVFCIIPFLYYHLDVCVQE